MNVRIRLTVKIILCLLYLLVIVILFTSAYRLFEKDKVILSWNKVKSTNDYTYIKVSQMSEAFAKIKGTDKNIHFVIEKEKNGQWYTYLVAINKKDYNKYKNIIDYSYERIKEKPKRLKVYGYPRKTNSNIKKIAIRQIKNFVPIENKTVINEKNFEKYMTNTYLDTTIKKSRSVNYIIVMLLVLALILMGLIFFTLFDRDKIVDEVDLFIEKEILKEREKNKNGDKDENNNDNIEIL